MAVIIEKLAKTYESRTGEQVRALDAVDLNIKDGEFVSFVGPSGCGKTTLLNLVGGLLEPSEGKVEVNGASPDRVTARPGMVFQAPTLLPWRTALQNVLMPAEVGRRGSLKARLGLGRSLESYKKRGMELLNLVGLERFEEKYPWELSGGMQQRVAIARALLLESNLLLLDEPFSALDEFTRESMNTELLRIWSAQRFTTLFVTHNIFEAIFLADRVVVMTPRPGKVVGQVEVSLPRPRSREMIGADAFASDVRMVRGRMQEYWEQEERDAHRASEA